MLHLIIGCGTVGNATGAWLEANSEEVFYTDIDKSKLNKLEEKGKKITKSYTEKQFDLYWICTPEWEVEKVLKKIPITNKVIVRSSTIPGTLDRIDYKELVHVPEFLKQRTALSDTFNPDRIIIGGKGNFTHFLVYDFLKETYPNKPIFATTLIQSEMIKLVSNAWLSTQISFWNEIYKICNKHNINPQYISDLVTLDKRISKYGSNMINQPFGGFCLPKDLNNLISISDKSILLKAVKKVNEEMIE